MHLDFETAAADIVEAQAQANRPIQEALNKDFALRGLLVAFMMAFFMSLGWAATISYKHSGTLSSDVGWFLAWLFGWLAIMFVWARLSASKRRSLYFSNLEPLPLSVRLDTTDEGIVLSDRYGRDLFYWKSFRGVSVLPKHLALTFGPPTRVIAIPFTAFGSIEEREAFEQALSSRAES